MRFLLKVLKLINLIFKLMKNCGRGGGGVVVGGVIKYDYWYKVF